MEAKVDKISANFLDLDKFRSGGMILAALLLILLNFFLLTSLSFGAKFKEYDILPISSAGSSSAKLSVQSADLTATKNRPYLAVMIDNHYALKAQVGLASADVVLESVSEAGITRYMGLFKSQDPFEFLPIRSIRQYFYDFASIVNATAVSVGGSSDALQSISSTSYPHLDATKQNFGFRISSLPPTHDFNELSPKLRLLSFDKLLPVSGNLFEYNDKKILNLSGIRTSFIDVKLSFTGKREYIGLFRYLPESGRYIRFRYDQQQFDAFSGEDVYTDNVLVLFSDVKDRANDPLLRVDINFLGGGDMMLFKDGQKIDGKFLVDKSLGKILLFDQKNNPITLNQGKVWVSLYDKKWAIDYNTISLSGN